MTSQDNNQHLGYLHEMGIQSWVLRKQPSGDVVENTTSNVPVEVTEGDITEVDVTVAM